MLAVTSFAQISTGEPTSKVYKVGNRAEEGDFGLYLGVKTSMFKDIFDGSVSVTALPLINLKYMATDQLEARLGIEFYQTAEKLKGSLREDNHTSSMNHRDGSTDFLLYPGVAYHFSRHNILDVYAGAEIPVGWSSYSTLIEEGSFYDKVTRRSFVIGLGAFVGLQAYIAKLPLAVGVEYGISAQSDTGLKYKTELTSNGKTQIFYSPDYEMFESVDADGIFDNLKARKGVIGNQVRLTLTYYFK